MAFLSAGHVPGEGPYGKNIEKGIRGVIKMQAPNGLIATDASREMYHHGICTLMLAETAGMTQGPLAADVKKALEKAVAIVLQAQRKGTSPTDQHKGGWRYRVAAFDSDISVTGWQIMALRAAKNVGCDVPPDAIEQAVAYVKRCQDPTSGAFRYFPHAQVTTACTGTSILCLAVTAKEPARKIPEAIKGEGHFFYSLDYCSQACFQLSDNFWESFRPRMHETLLRNQGAGGAWVGSDGQGPNYSTAMGVLALTVEYRFLPIYQRGEEPTDKK
jgi:hypothetical protein